ncbi:MAG: hypothetical protein F6K55_22380 [Moorea sp. SIO4A3]|nr:hypothetical protein [Moorena sp. SIO4A3]
MLKFHTEQKLPSTSPRRFKKALLFTAFTFSTGAIVALLSSSNPASAAPLSWVFQDVTFDDDGILFGSFDYDAEANLYSNFSITVTGGNTTLLPSFSYSPATSFLRAPLDATNLSITSNDSIVDTGLFITNRRNLFIEFEQPLTNAGGSIGILNPAGIGGDAEFNALRASVSPVFPRRGFASGTVVSVPVPESVPEPSFILGLIALSSLGLGSTAFRKAKG